MSKVPVAVPGRILWMQIVTLTGYGVMCLLSLLLLGYLRVRRRVAFKGDANATRKVILPAYEPLLWILAATTAIYTVFFCVALKLELYTKSFPNLDNEVFYAGRQFVFVLTLAFLYQKSVSLPALRRATTTAVLLATYTVPMVWLFMHFIPEEAELLFFTKLATRPLILLAVVYVCFVRPPAGRASPATLRAYAGYIFTYHVLLAASNLTKWYLGIYYDTYAVLSYALLIWGSLCPLLIWRLLRDDTEYWRGMGERVCFLQHVSRSPHSRSQPSTAVDEHISSRGIHVLIEMHRKFVIDFAHLELKRQIGTGSSADVFAGLLRSKQPVAIKVYTPRSFTEETVAEFSHEAALCATLSHPNIARFVGMCVCPPTICLVSELCQGTLEDMLHLQAQAHGRRSATRHLLQVSGDIEDSFGLERQQMLLNLGYMLDCARAVAYVHSFSPPFLHRDIRPANFLVDAECNVKLTDFGESRRLPRELPVVGCGVNRKSATTVESVMNASTTLSCGVASSSNASPAISPQAKMTVTGTVDYVAPEMIGTRNGLATYGEAADVYSLAITFWDVLYPDCDKYPTARRNHLQVLEGVLDGRRPALEEESMNSENAVPSDLRELIMSAWNGDATARPTAKQVVQVLETIQVELLVVFAQELSEDLERSEGKNFTGEFAVARMQELQATDALGEGVRLGRALMDAGFLHHHEHARGFKNGDESYFFDDGNTNSFQPLAMLEESPRTSLMTEGETRSQQQGQALPDQPRLKARSRTYLFSHLTATFSPSALVSSNAVSSLDENSTGGCKCRRLGQHLEAAASPVAGGKQLGNIGRGFSWWRASEYQAGRSRQRSTEMLTRKLLESEERRQTNDICDEEVSESLPIVRPAA